MVGASGMPARLVRIDNTAASRAALPTANQFTSVIRAVTGMMATAV